MDGHSVRADLTTVWLHRVPSLQLASWIVRESGQDVDLMAPLGQSVSDRGGHHRAWFRREPLGCEGDLHRAGTPLTKVSSATSLTTHEPAPTTERLPTVRFWRIAECVPSMVSVPTVTPPDIATRGLIVT